MKGLTISTGGGGRDEAEDIWGVGVAKGTQIKVVRKGVEKGTAEGK